MFAVYLLMLGKITGTEDGKYLLGHLDPNPVTRGAPPHDMDPTDFCGAQHRYNRPMNSTLVPNSAKHLILNTN